MKKLVLVACLMTICTFMSCGNKTESNPTTNDSDTIVVDSIDSLIVDSVVSQ